MAPKYTFLYGLKVTMPTPCISEFSAQKDLKLTVIFLYHILYEDYSFPIRNVVCVSWLHLHTCNMSKLVLTLTHVA